MVVGGVGLAGLLMMAVAVAIFSAAAWLVLYVSSVITDTGAKARNYPFAGIISIITGIVSAVGWMPLFFWMRGERDPYIEGAMLGSVLAVLVLLAVAMILLGLKLARLRRSIAA